MPDVSPFQGGTSSGSVQKSPRPRKLDKTSDSCDLSLVTNCPQLAVLTLARVDGGWDESSPVPEVDSSPPILAYPG